MAKKPEWERWEIAVNDQLGLEGTVASGATWKDKGDGSTRSGDAWPLLVDAKTTEAASYSLKFKFLDDLWKIAMQSGKTVALPLKFLGRKGETEWVVVPFSDYAYLVEQYGNSQEES